ncbi:hypothetical protein ACV33M_32705, partial [Pseudomonas aeruginosa]
MAGRIPLLRRRGVVTALLLGLVGTLLLPAAEAAPGAVEGADTMVALGDSYAAGPLVPVQVEQPWGCLR